MFFIPFTTEEQEGTSISKVEYWIDEDYNGRVSKATNETTIPIEVDIKGLGYGNHIISYRIVNDLGQYSELRRKMFYLGLEDEIKYLFSTYSKDLRALQAIGYKEFNIASNSEEAKELIKKNTRNYAKRQLTFFKHQFKDVIWFNSYTEAYSYLKEHKDEFR